MPLVGCSRPPIPPRTLLVQNHRADDGIRMASYSLISYTALRQRESERGCLESGQTFRAYFIGACCCPREVFMAYRGHSI